MLHLQDAIHRGWSVVPIALLSLVLGAGGLAIGVSTWRRGRPKLTVIGTYRLHDPLTAGLKFFDAVEVWIVAFNERQAPDLITMMGVTAKDKRFSVLSTRDEPPVLAHGGYHIARISSDDLAEHLDLNRASKVDGIYVTTLRRPKGYRVTASQDFVHAIEAKRKRHD